MNKLLGKESYTTSFLAVVDVLWIKVGGAYWPRLLLILIRSRPIGPSYRLGIAQKLTQFL